MVQDHTVHSDGNCVSYDELRRFLTSSAENDLHHVQSGIYMTCIPNSISLLEIAVLYKKVMIMLT